MAATRSTNLFETQSDTDSINTTTTAPSEVDSEAEYPVEKILAEERDSEGEVQYLVKWEGYPLHRSNWEPRAHVLDDVLLSTWEGEKAAVRRGEAVGFDVLVYDEAVEAFAEEEKRKKARRVAKRRKRARAAAAAAAAAAAVEESEDDFAGPAAGSRRRMGGALPARKGVAQRAKRGRRPLSAGVEDDDDDEHDPSSSDDKTHAASRLKQKGKQRAITSAVSPRKRSKSSTSVELPATSKTPRLESIVKQKDFPAVQGGPSTATRPLSAAQRLSEALAQHETALITTEAPRATAARKSAPAPAPIAKPKPNIFAGDWTKDKQRKQRARVNAETPKDSTDAQFTRLSIQNRFQKYSRNEPAPDPTALTMFDPRTGIIEPPKTVPASNLSGPGDIHRAYGRRSPPRSQQRRSPTPPSPNANTGLGQVAAPWEPRFEGGQRAKDPATCRYWQAGNCQYTADTCYWTHAYPDAPAARQPDVPASKKRGVCPYWRRGHCKKPAAECLFAHYEPTKKQTTCWYWRKGHCIKPDNECEFAHFDTGFYAGQPGTYVRKSFSEGRVPAEVRQFVAAASPVDTFYDAPERLPLVQSPVADEWNTIANDAANDVTSAASGGEYAAQTLTEANNIVPSTEHEEDTLGVQTPHLPEPAVTMASPARDPRMRGRAPVRADTPLVSESREGSQRPKYRSLSLNEEYDMAKKGQANLDSHALISNSKGGNVAVVFIHMPHERKAEMGLLVDLFERQLRIKTVTSMPGDVAAWDYVRKGCGGSCLLVFHPTEHFNDHISGLHKFLTEHGSTVRAYSIGVQYDLCMREGRKLTREGRKLTYEAQRIFPHGGMMFISDDVFVYYPEKATAIIDNFRKEAEDKQAGGVFSKIAARPGIKDWLARLAEAKLEERNGGQVDSRWSDCYEAVCRLCPPQDEDGYYKPHSVPNETSYLWSPWEESLPSFQGKWERDEAGATEQMVEFFAASACCVVSEYRKFHFVYQRPEHEGSVVDAEGQLVQRDSDPHGWMEKYCHVGVVTPDQALKPRKK